MPPLSHHGGFPVSCRHKHPYLIKKSSPSLPFPKSQVIALSPKRTTGKIQVDFSGKQMRFGRGPHFRCRASAHIRLIMATAAKAVANAKKAEPPEAEVNRVLVTGFIFFVMWTMYLLYNDCTSSVYEYFPFPFFLSAVHLLVSVACYFYGWSMGFHQIAPIDMDLLKVIAPTAVCQAIGHVFSNISILTLRWSSAQSSRAMEPLITAVGSQLILGQRIPLAVWMSLAHVVIGVSMICFTEFPFNQIGFRNEIIATLSRCLRMLSKKAMNRLESRNVQVYMSIIALFFCLPAAICIDGPKIMQYGFKNAVAKKGMVRFMYELLIPGLFYHLHNTVVIITLERVTPIANVLIRGFVIALLFGGNVITSRSTIGAAFAIYGALVYLWMIR